MLYDDPYFFVPPGELIMPFQNPFQSNLPDPWRCGHCKILIYNVALDPVTNRWVPVPGAPLRAAWSAEYGDICQTCADMIESISKYSNGKENTYMTGLHAEYLRTKEAAKAKLKRLGRNLSDGKQGDEA